MNKLRIFSALLVVAVLFSALSGCSCNHKWAEANCGAPKTCSLCGVTEGETVGEHTWQEATTDAPKTCSVCGATEGEKIETDPRFHTSKCKTFFGTWEGYVTQPATMYDGAPDYTVTIKVTMVFSKDGHAQMTVELQNPDELVENISLHLTNLIYETYAVAGLSATELDEMYQSNYSMTVPEYCTQIAEENIMGINSSAAKVYYADQGRLYSADRWTDKMESEKYRFSNGKLLLNDNDFGKMISLIRVAE